MVNPQYLSMKQQILDAMSDPDLPIVALAEFLTGEEQIDISGEWKQQHIPDQFSYATKDIDMKLIREFVQQVFAKEPLHEGSRRFSHRDFTLLHDENIPEPGLLCLYFLEDFPEEWGGQIVFMRDGELLGRFTPQKNTLLIVDRKKDVQYFVQYVNHMAEYPLHVLSP